MHSSKLWHITVPIVHGNVQLPARSVVHCITMHIVKQEVQSSVVFCMIIKFEEKGPFIIIIVHIGLTLTNLEREFEAVPFYYYILFAAGTL